MHAGRDYPFHPEYWATEAWFWPGFVPWKMALTVFSTSTPPWNIYVSGYGENSIAGIPTADSKVIEYRFVHFEPSHGLFLRLEKVVVAGVPYARWTLDLVSPFGVWGRAINDQVFPQRRVFNLSWPTIFGSIPYPAMGPPAFQFRPSRYDEVGSPWPNY